MKIKSIKTLAALATIVVLAVAGPTQKSFAGDIELIIGTGSIKGKLFAAGNAISIASALHGKGFKIYNYGTKGSKDNIKRVTKKKKSINFGMVTAKDLSKAKAKKLKKLSGLMSLGTLGGKNILLIVRNKAPKKVSKESYAAAIANAVGLLQSGKAKKRIKAAWGGYAPASASAAFKKVNVKLHKAAIN